MAKGTSAEGHQPNTVHEQSARPPDNFRCPPPASRDRPPPHREYTATPRCRDSSLWLPPTLPVHRGDNFACGSRCWLRRRCAGRRSAGNVDGLRLFLIAAHDCRGHGKEKDGHADDRTNDSCDSFHNAVSLPRWDSGTAQSVVCSDNLFRMAKKEQRSSRARCPSAALSDVRL